MKILFAVPRYHPNHDGIVLGLLDAGHEVEFLVRAVHPGERHRDGVVVTRLPGSRWFRFVFGLLRRRRPDVVVARNADRISYWIFLACRLLGIRYLLYVLYPGGYESMRLGRRLRLALGLWPRHTINSAVPVPDRDVAGKTYDFLPFAIEPGPAKAAYPAARPIQVLAVGKFDQERKNHVPLVRHLAPLLRDGVIDLTIVGTRDVEPSPAYSALLGEIEAQGLTERVCLRENLSFEQMLRLYPRYDLFVMASSNERAGIARAEAMAAGLAAVCGSDSGINYFTVPGENGLIFPDGDFAAMADLVRSLAADPAELERMGRNARRAIVEHYTPREYERRFMEVMQRQFGVESRTRPAAV